MSRTKEQVIRAVKALKPYRAYACVLTKFLDFNVVENSGYWSIQDSDGNLLSDEGAASAAVALDDFAENRWEDDVNVEDDADKFLKDLQNQFPKCFVAIEDDGDWKLTATGHSFGPYHSRTEAIFRGGLQLRVTLDETSEICEVVDTWFDVYSMP